MPAANRSHYSRSYARRAATVRAQAYADPTTRCRRCGKTLAEVPGSTWDAGHVIDGQIDGPLAPEHAGCNRSAGARLGNQRRKGLRTSRRW
jgi:hypothetical protein